MVEKANHKLFSKSALKKDLERFAEVTSKIQTMFLQPICEILAKFSFCFLKAAERTK